MVIGETDAAVVGLPLVLAPADAEDEANAPVLTVLLLLDEHALTENTAARAAAAPAKMLRHCNMNDSPQRVLQVLRACGG
jgi:hypothetical protein